MMISSSILLAVGFLYLAIQFGCLAYKNHHPNTPLFWLMMAVSLSQATWFIVTLFSPSVTLAVKLLSRALLGFPVMALFAAVLVLRRDDNA